MSLSAAKSVATIDEYLKQVGAAEKTADTPLSEPGSIGGETAHPVKNVDDRLQDPKEGERFKENTKDVKEDQGPPSIENAGEAKAASVFNTAKRLAKRAEGAVMQGGSAADDHLQIGTNVQATGDDPSNETSSAKGGKDDKRQGNMGGTDHPASTENESLDGHKYAFDENTPDDVMSKMAQDLGNEVLAELAWLGEQQDVPVKTAAAPAAPAGQRKQAAVGNNVLRQAGWELAGLLDGSMDKTAADNMVVDTIEEVIKEANDDADRWIAYADAWVAQKQANEDGAPPPEEAGEGPPAEGGGGEDMLAALGGAGGGAPPDAGGGMPGGEAGMPGGESPADIVLALMEQLGVSPEEVLAAGGGAGGGMGGDPAGGGMPPGGAMPPPPMAAMAGGGAGGPPPGGPPPGGPPGGPPGMEVAASDRNKANAVKNANTRAYITELFTRNQQRRTAA